MRDPDSYGAGATNIKNLPTCITKLRLQKRGFDKTGSRPVYIEGIGTDPARRTASSAKALGGERRVVGRVQTSFTFIKQIIEDALQENPNSEIASITLTLSVSVEVQPPLVILQ
jgi:hypothetical protein